MHSLSTSPPPAASQSVLRAIGSLWFAAVLLVLLLVAMACATVFETMHSAERALAVFYRAWWFTTLLALLAINVAAAVIVRFPLTRHQIGFALTHCGILIILLGALVTRHYGIDGQVGIAEGQTVKDFTLRDQPTITLKNRTSQVETVVDLNPDVFTGFEPAGGDDLATLQLPALSVTVQRFLPDSAETREVVDDNPVRSPAVELLLTSVVDAHEHPLWLFENRPAKLGPYLASFRTATDANELARLLDDTPKTQTKQDGRVSIAINGAQYNLPLQACRTGPVPVADTGYTVRVLRYMPHASVGPDNKMINVSPRQVNPAIEAEIVGPAGRETRIAFARFPDFDSMHADTQVNDLKLTFVAPKNQEPTTPIEVVAGPNGKMVVRFQQAEQGSLTQSASIGSPMETPWPGKTLTILHRFDKARFVRSVGPVDPIRKSRDPAVMVRIATKTDTNDMWLQKNRAYPLTVDGKAYELSFADKRVALGFDLKLNDFRLGYYPGSRRPRSFESTVTISDTAIGASQTRVISMNNPTSYGGYTLFQSSYRQEEGREISYLSVSRDPGQTVAFAGYITMLAGMLFVLITRMGDHRRVAQAALHAAAQTPADARRVIAARVGVETGQKTAQAVGLQTPQGRRNRTVHTQELKR